MIRDSEIDQELKANHKVSRSTNGRAQRPLIEIMESIEEEEIDWLWNKRLARGKLSLVEGDPGVGKSYMTLAIAAALSRGDALPMDREPEAPLKSLIISREDNPADTIKPRLRLLGANMSMIAVPYRDSRPSLDPNYINSVLVQWPAALVVIDPILALAAGKNTDRAADVRSLLDPLVRVAADHRATMLMVRHLNKATGMKAMYRGQGSIDFAAICRMVFTVAADLNTPGGLLRRTKFQFRARIQRLNSLSMIRAVSGGGRNPRKRPMRSWAPMSRSRSANQSNSRRQKSFSKKSCRPEKCPAKK